MPFHPRFLVGLHQIFKGNLKFLNFACDTKLLPEVESSWTFLDKKDFLLHSGFDHKVLGKLGVNAFKEVMEKEAEITNVCPKEIIDFLSHKELSNTTKCIWMAAKDLHTCFNSEAMATTDSDEGDDSTGDSDEGDDLLELTKTDGEEESELFDDSSKESAQRKVMKGTIEQVKLKGRMGSGQKNVVDVTMWNF